MKQIQLFKSYLAVGAISLLSLMAACSPKVDQRGYIASNDVKAMKDELVIGQTTSDQVLEKFGSPSSQSSFGDNTWYYISSRKETQAFLKGEVVEQNVVRIEFDQAGVVQKVETFDKNNSKDVSIVKRTTPTEGHQLGFIEQVIGNIGRFNRSDDGSSAPGRRSGN